MHRMTATLAFLALLGGLFGCQADKTQSWDYGKSFHAVFDNQKIDPTAGDDTPVVGMDGEKAAMAYDRYQQAKPSEKESAANPIVMVRGQ
ncbi:conserved hypothetical protein [Solidesulfovibrio fructosivorans JJ]]|uniref:Lipoprotein n=1 Tax=Solidesulfovibrio fructosivorans JJ] TaxID=596151 RepID=E1JZJ3_SOLFR|nr:hypothetical protein [Solidesulfovibrio fructosivorans]EFL50240.1 conserved hypothetical protein [Solidesulfovibrio fructosivorans JJ]]